MQRALDSLANDGCLAPRCEWLSSTLLGCDLPAPDYLDITAGEGGTSFNIRVRRVFTFRGQGFYG